MSDWQEKMQEFRHFALRRQGSIRMVADECHIGERTAKRLIAGEIENPRPSVRKCVEQYIQGQKARSGGVDAED